MECMNAGNEITVWFITARILRLCCADGSLLCL